MSSIFRASTRGGREGGGRKTQWVYLFLSSQTLSHFPSSLTPPLQARFKQCWIQSRLSKRPFWWGHLSGGKTYSTHRHLIAPKRRLLAKSRHSRTPGVRVQGVRTPLPRWPAPLYYKTGNCTIGNWSKTWDAVEEFMLNAVKMLVKLENGRSSAHPLLRILDPRLNPLYKGHHGERGTVTQRNTRQHSNKG